MRQYKEYRLHDAEKALEENLSLLDPAKHKSARLLTVALLGICGEIRSLKDDVGSLHNKLQPILKEMENERGFVRDWKNPQP